ncbi:MAG: PQQ-dependent sugar dehydrogenase [Planctomycetota bacterium]
MNPKSAVVPFTYSTVLSLALLLVRTWPTANALAQEKTDADSVDGAKPARTLWENRSLLGSPDPSPPFRTEQVFSKVTWKQPLFAVQEPGARRLWVVEQAGRILALDLDRPDRAPIEVYKLVDHDFYAMTFHPKFAENRQIFIFSNGPNSQPKKQNRILRYVVPADDPPKIADDSRVEILAWDSNGHNGGDLAFGPDGYLYLSAGDGTSDSDGDLTGQKLDDLTGGIVRIDVDQAEGDRTYRIPPDNPFRSAPGARPENYAYGMRNPWRLTFHAHNGDLLVADVGQDWVEMIYRVKAGGNYGWSIQEGSKPFQPLRKQGPSPILPPLVEHPHSESRSITGGVVYTGAKFPELTGTYVYGDYATGKIWALRYSDDQVTQLTEIADSPLQIVAFCQDDAGEIYVIDHASGLHRLIRSPQETIQVPFPRMLSETGLFGSTEKHELAPGIIPYSVIAPLWSDGAHKERYLALPGAGRATYTETGAWQFPDGTVLVKTFSLPLASQKDLPRRIETRLLVRRLGEWQGYSYRWREDQRDADLVQSQGLDHTFTVRGDQPMGNPRPQKWHYPSRAECMVCHTRAAGYVLGLQTLQMHRDVTLRDKTIGQLDWLVAQDIFGNSLPGERDKLPRLTDPADETADLNLRARSYLHANWRIVMCQREVATPPSIFISPRPMRR